VAVYSFVSRYSSLADSDHGVFSIKYVIICNIHIIWDGFLSAVTKCERIRVTYLTRAANRFLVWPQDLDQLRGPPSSSVLRVLEDLVAPGIAPGPLDL
jgi:hypothetical protein